MDGRTLKQRLQAFMGAQYSLTDIARQLGINPQNLQTWFAAADVKSGTIEKLADLLALTPANVADGRIIYTRRKTHRLYSVKIPPEAQTIIDRHRGDRLLLDFAEKCADYRHFANKANIYLHTIRKGLTMYWARHTWATVAASLDIPDDTISLALGHSARNATTDIYIRRDLSKVDDANAKVIAFVLSESEK